MKRWMGAALAIAAMFAGGALWGWKGVLLTLTVVVFWLLVEFSRLLRLMKAASEGPLGQVENAVMLHAQLQAGMPVAELIAMTRSLGKKLGSAPETYGWQDPGGARVEVVISKGQVDSWRLLRLDAPALVQAPATAADSDPNKNQGRAPEVS